MAVDKEQQVVLVTTEHDVDTDTSCLQSWRLFIVTASLCLGAVLYGLDMNIIGVAVPVITTQFHSLDDIAWYSAAYLMTITAFQPCFGNVYKYFPAKAVFVGSIFLFESRFYSWRKRTLRSSLADDNGSRIDSMRDSEEFGDLDFRSCGAWNRSVWVAARCTRNRLVYCETGEGSHVSRFCSWRSCDQCDSRTCDWRCTDRSCWLE